MAQQGLAESPEIAMRLIMSGGAHFLKDGQKIPVDSPGQQFPDDTEFALRGQDRFVSRGGYKLLTAIEELGFNPLGKLCLDAGASTGGFTDCLLQFGACASTRRTWATASSAGSSGATRVWWSWSA